MSDLVHTVEAVESESGHGALPMPSGREFGHIYGGGKGFRFDGWGAGPFIIRVPGNRTTWRFEDSDRFGPALLKLDGDLKANPYPPEHSPFWRAHWLWREQGRRLEADGKTCIWREPKPFLYAVSRRHLQVVVSGEPGGLDIVVLPKGGMRVLDTKSAITWPMNEAARLLAVEMLKALAPASGADGQGPIAAQTADDASGMNPLPSPSSTPNQKEKGL